MIRSQTKIAPHATVARQRQARPRRLLYLDLFRGLAVLSMIQGHTFTALLQPSAYGASWLPWYTLVHGLTAPMFLVGGGLAYGVVTLRASTKHARLNTAIVRRAMILFAVGYALQVPSAPWAEIFARRDMLQKMLQVGPLQLVGACLLCCELLRVITRTRVLFLGNVALFAALIMLLSPWSWQARLSTRVPLMVGTWFDGYAGSLFPFFPWAVFFAIGVLLSLPALRMRERALQAQGRELGFALVLTVLGCVMASLAYALYTKGLLMRGFYGDYELWHTSPLYLLFRSGLVVACLGILCALEPAFAFVGARAAWLGSALGPLSRQSLVAYVSHLLILYGTPLTPGLVRLRTTLSLPQACVVFAAILVLTILIVRVWERYVTSGAASTTLGRTRDLILTWCSRQIDGIGER